MRLSERFAEITHREYLYNILPIENIPSVMRYGLLSYEKAKNIGHKSIAMIDIQKRRELISVPFGKTLHFYANVYFDPRNPMLYKVKVENENICILAFDKTILDFDGVVITDRNASSSYASFYTTEEGLTKIDFQSVYAQNWNDDEIFRYYRKKSIKCAEVLIPDSIPYRCVVNAIVCGDTSKTKLEKTGFDKDIIINPSFFF